MTADALVENIPRFVLLAILIAASGLISASETALFTLTRQQLNRFRQSRNPAILIILRLREKPSDLLSTVLLANIAINIWLYSMLGILVARLAGDSAAWMTLLGLVGFGLVLFGAEIIPKLVAFSLSERFAPFAALPLQFLAMITLPVRRVLGLVIVEPLTRILSPSEPSGRISADELQQLVSLSLSEGLIDERENVLLHQLMHLADLRVSALMVPRVDVVAHDLSDDPSVLLRLIKRHRLLRIPIYQNDIDNIKGIVSSKEYLHHRERPIENLIRPVRFIPEQATVEALLKHFRQTRTQLAIVVDEYGGLAGIVALEDVVEAIVGELRAQEERTAPPLLQRLDDKTFLVDAGLDVNDFCDAFELPLEERRINTVAGLIADKLDRLPETNEQIRIGHATLTVIGMARRRVLRVRVDLDEPPSDNPDLTILLQQSASSGATGRSGPSDAAPMPQAGGDNEE